MTKKKPENMNQIFKVPNTILGLAFIDLCKRYKSSCYKIRLKGRTINRKKVEKEVRQKCVTRPLTAKVVREQVERISRWRNNDGSIPMHLADNIGVYFDCNLGTIGARQARSPISCRISSGKISI